MALAVIDHIVSTTAIVVPVERVIRVLRKVWRPCQFLPSVMSTHLSTAHDETHATFTFLQHGVENILVDGAHSPGSIPLDIPSIGADYYVGNLHKCAFFNQSSKRPLTNFRSFYFGAGMFAPAACAVLHVSSPDHLERMHPLTVSHNWGQVMQRMFEAHHHSALWLIAAQGLVAESSMLGTKDYSSHCIVYDSVL